MQTAAEYIAKPRGNPENTLWLHGMDALEHILQGDTDQTAFKDRGDSREHLNTLKREMETPCPTEDFQEALEEVEFSKPRWKARASQEGDFEVEAWLNGESACFTEYFKDSRQVNAISVVLDMVVPWRERHGAYMAPRHRKVYQIALEAEAQGIPCRVVACFSEKVPEYRKDLRIFLVIKDYDDPIFPGLWGGLKSNLTANAFINCFMDYIVGTRHPNNGNLQYMEIGDDFWDDEVILIEPRFVRK
ncbi:MAG: hypothetical protein ACLFUU_12905 [Desulfobacteraceae bacterium]